MNASPSNDRRPVLFICDDPGRGGCSAVARALWRRLELAGHPIVFVSDLQSRDAADELLQLYRRGDPRVAHFAVDESRLSAASWDMRRALALVSELEPRLVVFHDSAAYQSMLALKRAARILGAPFIAMQHLVMSNYDGGVEQIVPRQLRWLQSTERVIFASRDNADRFARAHGLNSSKVAVIANGVAASDSNLSKKECRARILDVTGFPPDACVMVLVGRVERRKGQLKAVTALAKTQAMSGGGHLCLTFVGSVDETQRSEIMRLAEHQGVAEKVCFLGQRRDVRSLMSGADIVLQLGEGEGLPLTVVEAMAESAAILAHPAGGVLEAVNPDCAVILPASDPDTLAAAMIDLARAPEKRHALGQAARRRFEVGFTEHSMVAGHAALIESVLQATTERGARRFRRQMQCAISAPFAIDFKRDQNVHVLGKPQVGWNFLTGDWEDQGHIGVAAGDDAQLDLPMGEADRAYRLNVKLRMARRTIGRTITVLQHEAAIARWRCPAFRREAQMSLSVRSNGEGTINLKFVVERFGLAPRAALERALKGMAPIADETAPLNVLSLEISQH